MTAIIFDLDGTLVDSLGDIHSALSTMLVNAGQVPLDRSTVSGFVGRGSSHLVRCALDEVGLLIDDVGHAMYLAEFLKIYTGTSGRFTTVYRGVYDALSDLKASGSSLGLCTNKPEANAYLVLDQFKLTSFFDSVVGGDRLPTRKPDPAMLNLAMRELAVNTCLFVGDSEVDVETATAAGVPIALFTRGYRKTPVADLAPAFSFEQYKELRNVVDLFLSRSA